MDAIEMVRRNRDCHPGGTKVYLVNQASFDEQDRRIAVAQREREEALAAMEDMALHLRLNRVALVMALTAAATLGWLIGLMM